jgi:hypothetical protein
LPVPDLSRVLSRLNEWDHNGTVLAVAGRRIDAEDAEESRFPSRNEVVVATRLRELMVSAKGQAVVCSAACGSDILTLETAAHLGLRRRVVLPFSRQQFRAGSVADRGENWGRRFDAVLAQLRGEDVVEMNLQPDDKNAYAAANSRILDEATEWAVRSDCHALAVVVWNGFSRGADDLTDEFRRLALARNLEAISVPTL